MPLDRGASWDSRLASLLWPEPSILTPPPAMVKSLGRKNLESVKLATGAVWAPWQFAPTNALARKKQTLCRNFQQYQFRRRERLGDGGRFQHRAQSPSSPG